MKCITEDDAPEWKSIAEKNNSEVLMGKLLRIIPGTLVLTEGLLGARDICKIYIFFFTYIPCILIL
jgi:hypothetical protein